MASSCSGTKQNEMGDYTAIDIDEDPKEWSVVSIKEKLKKLSPPTRPKHCINRIPESIRKVNEDAYTPQILSIGPVHHDIPNLKAMEEHKWRYMNDLLGRSPGESLDACGKAILELKEEARNCYAETIDLGQNNNFEEMMLLDGCFIIEFFLKCLKEDLRDKDDPIFNVTWMLLTLQHDLLILENQIPFIVLETLYDRLVQHVQPSRSFVELTLDFFSWAFDIIPMESGEKFNQCWRGNHHLLHLFHHCYLPLQPSDLDSDSDSDSDFLQCATELRRGGITFRKGESHNLLDIKFNPKDGVLEIPTLRVEDDTETIFRNLIALEQFSQGITQHFTSYATIMDMLINSKQDVELLQQRRIINNWLGDEEEVSVLFNKLGKGLAVEQFYFGKLCKEIDKYYSTPWHKRKATLKRVYFNSPWAYFSFGAAIALLLLTILQTVFSILSYAHDKSKG